METEKMIKELTRVADKHADDKLFTGDTNITQMCTDVIRKLEELKEYQNLGTILQLSNRVNEEDILKFYYCESRDEYYVGKRFNTMYYARVALCSDKVTLSFEMSRYLPWGEHVVDNSTLWKEHTYPSEPKEIHFSEWLEGWIKKNIVMNN